MKAKTINEALSDVLKPKTTDEITKAIPQDKMKFVEECYELVRSSGKYDIVSDLGFMSGMFGFQFETKFPMTKEQSIYHTGEIGEFTLGFIAEENDVYIIFENAGSDYHLEDIEDLRKYLGMEHEGLTESITDILKPKTEEELRKVFEESHPEFVKIFYKMFPKEKYSLGKGESGLSGSFVFSTTKRKKTFQFLVSQNEWHKHPTISVLRTSPSDAAHGLGGVFVDSTIVHDYKDVERYVKMHTSIDFDYTV